MEAVLLRLEDVVFTRQSLLWTFTSSALRHLRALHLTHTQVCAQATVPGRIHLSHTHTGVCRALKHVHCVRGGVEIIFKLKGIMQ